MKDSPINIAEENERMNAYPHWEALKIVNSTQYKGFTIYEQKNGGAQLRITLHNNLTCYALNSIQDCCNTIDALLHIEEHGAADERTRAIEESYQQLVKNTIEYHGKTIYTLEDGRAVTRPNNDVAFDYASTANAKHAIVAARK